MPTNTALPPFKKKGKVVVFVPIFLNSASALMPITMMAVDNIMKVGELHPSPNAAKDLSLVAIKNPSISNRLLIGALGVACTPPSPVQLLKVVYLTNL